MVYVDDLLREHGKDLGLELIVNNGELKRRIHRPEVHRPGLSLAGFMKKFVPSRLLVFGNSEVLYLKELTTELQSERLRAILTDATPAVVVACKYLVPKKIVQVCREKGIPLFKTSLPTMDFISKRPLFWLMSLLL